MKLATVVLLPLFAGSYVAAHGILRRITIQGKLYEGDDIDADPGQTVIRHVSSENPITKFDNKALTCGNDAQPAPLVADANAGDTITFDWRSTNNDKWPHERGPMLTYMASCGSVSCDKFDQADAMWFKIHEVGQKEDREHWFVEDLINGDSAAVQIPSNLIKGNYLIRHEIIALHLADKEDGAEFYVGCAQLRLESTGTGVPKDSELVKLPGAYKESDPGFYTPGIYDGPIEYKIPGPEVASLAAGPGEGTPDKSKPVPNSPVEGTSSAAAKPSASPVGKKPAESDEGESGKKGSDEKESDEKESGKKKTEKKESEKESDEKESDEKESGKKKTEKKESEKESDEKEKESDEKEEESDEKEEESDEKEKESDEKESVEKESVAARYVGLPRRISHVMRRMASFHRSH